MLRRRSQPSVRFWSTGLLAAMRETEMRIGNYKTLYNSDGVICGTHSVFEEGMDETIVMCVAELSEDGKKLKKWTITRANLYKNQDTEKDNAKLGFFL